jgi:hypothetical protein
MTIPLPGSLPALPSLPGLAAVSLSGLATAFAGALRNGALTVTAGTSGAAALDGFLATLPAQSLTLYDAVIEPPDQQWPARLVVRGTLTGTWFVPGLMLDALRPTAATITYHQDQLAAPVTADLELDATLAAGPRTLALHGTLTSDGGLHLAMSEAAGASLSLGDAVAVAGGGAAPGGLADIVPAGVALFGSLRLSAAELRIGGAYGTALTFTLDTEPGATWDIVPGQHVLKKIGVSVIIARQPASLGGRLSLGANVHATLHLGQDFEVIVGLTPNDIWEVDVVATAGLPILESLASAIGAAGEDVTGALRSLGLGDITVQAVSLGIDRRNNSLAYAQVRGWLTVAGAEIDVVATLPRFAFGGTLSPRTPVSLSGLLASTLATSAPGAAAGLPDVTVTALSLQAAPSTGSYALCVTVEDDQVTVGRYGLRAVRMDLSRAGGTWSGGILADVVLGGTELLVSGAYRSGWELSGKLDRLSLASLINEVLDDVGLPEVMSGAELRNLAATWNLTSGSYTIDGELDLDVEAGPVSVKTTFALHVSYGADAQGNKSATGWLTGTLALGGMNFGLRYDFRPGQQVLKGTWDTKNGFSLTALASAFGLDVPASGDGVALPELSVSALSFEIDWATAGERAFRLAAVTSLGSAFFIVDKPAPDQTWGFAFGVSVSGATKLSQLLEPVGLDVDALDFFELDGAFFVLSSAQFKALSVPGFAALGGRPLALSPGLSAGVLLNLGTSSDRPDVTALQRLMHGKPSVLLAEVTLGTSLSALAVTVQLSGGVTIAGSGASSITLADVSLILKAEPLALSLRGSIEFPVGDVELLATGFLTAGIDGVTAAFDIQGENGRELPFPFGFKGVHLYEIGVALAVTLEPPAVAFGLLGKFTVGPPPIAVLRPAALALPVTARELDAAEALSGSVVRAASSWSASPALVVAPALRTPPALAASSALARAALPAAAAPAVAGSLSALPPPASFVMIMGLEGEVPNPLLLSMYLQELSVGKAIEAFTDEVPSGLPDVLTGIRATDLMIYWCDSPAGIQQPDGTWAYPGFGFNATLDLYGFHAHADLKIGSGSSPGGGLGGGISGNACIDPLHMEGVIDLTGDGPGTPATYTGQVTIAPGGAQVHLSTLASPYLDISWNVTLFNTVSQSLDAELTTAGFTFNVDTEAPGFSSKLSCALRTTGSFSMDFSVLLDFPADLGQLNGVPLGLLDLNGTHLTAHLKATVAPNLSITIDGNFDYHGVSYTLPHIEESVAYSSLAAIPQEIYRQVRDEATSVFGDIRATADRYLNLFVAGLVSQAMDPGSVLRQGYGYSADQVVTAMRTAGFDIDAVTSALHTGFGLDPARTAQLLRSAGVAAAAVGAALKAVFNSSPDEAGAALVVAGYAIGELTTTLRDVFGRSQVQSASILFTIKVNASDAAKALHDVYGIDPGQAAVLLQLAGYGVADISIALRFALGVQPGQATGVLQFAGYPVDQIAMVLASVWNAQPNELAGYLAAGEYPLSQVGGLVESLYRLNPEQLGQALEAAGYPAQQIASFFDTLGGAFAEAVKKLDPTTW